MKDVRCLVVEHRWTAQRAENGVYVRRRRWGIAGSGA